MTFFRLFSIEARGRRSGPTHKAALDVRLLRMSVSMLWSLSVFSNTPQFVTRVLFLSMFLEAPSGRYLAAPIHGHHKQPSCTCSNPVITRSCLLKAKILPVKSRFIHRHVLLLRFPGSCKG